MSAVDVFLRGLCMGIVTVILGLAFWGCVAVIVAYMDWRRGKK